MRNKRTSVKNRNFKVDVTFIKFNNSRITITMADYITVLHCLTNVFKLIPERTHTKQRL